MFSVSMVTPYLEKQQWIQYMNHVYIRKRVGVRRSTYKCWDSECPSKLLTGDVLPPTGPSPAHNHEPHLWVVERNQLFHRLRERATSEPTALAQIYNEEAVRHPDGAAHLLLENVLPSLRKWRRVIYPPVPEDLAAYARALTQTPHGHLLLGIVNAAGPIGGSAVVLGMPTFRECLRLAEIVIVDGTFNAAPAGPRTVVQLLTLHVIYQGRYFHPIIALMENRTRSLYSAIFQLVWRLAERPTPGVILTDYEEGLSGALQEVCPGARVLGCFFHYAQALQRRARRLGISTTARGRELVRLYIALALLPAPIVPAALADMPGTAASADAEFVPAYDEYFRGYWMQRIGPERFSVGAELTRTSNVAEAFHKQLNAAVRRHPNIWELTAVLQQKFVVTETRFRAHGENRLPAARNYDRHLARWNECRQLHRELAAGAITLRTCHLQLRRVIRHLDDNDAAVDDIGAEVEVEDAPAAIPAAAAAAIPAAAVAAIPAAAAAIPAAAAAAIPAAAAASIPAAAAAAIPAAASCQICEEHNFDSAFVPCGHTICSSCANNLERHREQFEAATCPFCRSNVRNLLRLYF